MSTPSDSRALAASALSPALPFLRSPPFPWVASEVAAVATPGASTLADPAALLAAIRDARVGGAFWAAGQDDPWRERSDIVRAHPTDDIAITAWIMGMVVADRAGTPVPEAVLREAALDRLAAASYRDPYEGRATDAMAAVAILAGWRRMIDRNRPIAAAAGMALWKRDAIAQFLWNGGDLRFETPNRALDGGGVVAYWPSRVPDGFAGEAAARGVEAWPVEDGFVRSSGLGAECRPPMSVIIDRTGGIYFDPSRASELETILATHEFDLPLLDRARTLREAIVAARIGKYGVDVTSSVLEDLPRNRPVILAVGQVDDDLSVVHGGAGLAGNTEFLARVRAEEPDAFIVYRPHPDVAAGLRRGRVADPVAAGLADRVVSGGSLLDVVERADGVHVLSSLTGFEALLRGRPVTVHGSPFYAGWGLTRDLVPQPSRRGRRLSLDALVAGALILAPRYRDPVTELPCEPELLVARLAEAPSPSTTLVTGFRMALGATRRTLAAVGERL